MGERDWLCAGPSFLVPRRLSEVYVGIASFLTVQTCHEGGAWFTVTKHQSPQTFRVHLHIMAEPVVFRKSSRCRYCKEPIYPRARRCNACGSFQDWRRFFDFSAVILSLLVALVSVLSAIVPQIANLLPPWGSKLKVSSYYFSTDAVSLLVENRGNKPGHIGRVKAVVYCKGLYFTEYGMTKEQLATHIPPWGVEIDLGTSQQTSRIVPERTSREIPFVLSKSMLEAWAKSFPAEAVPLVGDFALALGNESIHIRITAELWNYGENTPTLVEVTPSPDIPFRRDFAIITQEAQSFLNNPK
jgi:hypothetical protein